MAKYLTSRSAAVYLGRSRQCLRELAATGELPGFKHRGQWHFDPAILEEWKKAHPKQTRKLDLSSEEIAARCEGRPLKQVARELGVIPEAVGYHLRKLGKGRYKQQK